jgi:hypothetical protein
MEKDALLPEVAITAPAEDISIKPNAVFEAVGIYICFDGL